MAHPRRTARRRRWSAVIPIATVTVAALSVAVVVLPKPAGHPPVSSASPASPSTPITARDILLVAADHVAASSASSPATGHFWYTDIEFGERFDVGRSYAVLRKMDIRTWQALTAGTPSVALMRSLGGTPLDEKAWRADGSPTKWELPAVTVRTAPDPAFGPPRRLPDDREFPLVGGTVTAAELAKLPADADQLHKWLRARIQSTEPVGYSLFYGGKALVMQLPVSPAVRAAAYRMIAGLDGVRSLGRVTDRKGRPGIAVAYDKTHLILDPGTGQALAEESWDRGTLMSYTAVTAARFTDEAR